MTFGGFGLPYGLPFGGFGVPYGLPFGGFGSPFGGFGYPASVAGGFGGVIPNTTVATSPFI